MHAKVTTTWLGAEAARQSGRLFLWLPVAMAAGAALYLNLPHEPPWAACILPSILTFCGWLLLKRFNLPAYVPAIVLLMFYTALGITAAKLRTESVRAPVVNIDNGGYAITARIVDIVSPSADRPRLLLEPLAMNHLATDRLPKRLRITLRPGVIESQNLMPGDVISAYAQIDPPAGPSMPGGYDFARTAWFERIGGTGFVFGHIVALNHPSTALSGDKSVPRPSLNRARWALNRSLFARIAPGFPGDPALPGFAAALVTGYQAMIPQTLIGHMRDSGLAHILSISGVHMAIFGGLVFFALRWLMAAIPPLALRLPVKKIAAGLSILLIFLYLLLSGMPAPAIRAAIVASVALLAVIFDRRALSLRSLAISAMLIIAVTPESVIQPGFQMSFVATAALLAVFEVWPARLSEISVPWWVKSIQTTLDGMRLSLVISGVATLATLPLAVAYFNRIALYGLVSNLFEAPITAIVMPCLALGTALSATPIGWLFLRLAACGLWLIEQIAAFTAGLPHAVITIPSAPDFVFPISLLGIVWVCLIRGKMRWLGVIAAAAILWWPRPPAPDIWLDPQGGNAAIRVADGAYTLRKVRRFGADQWMQHYGLKSLDNSAYVCRGYGCIPTASAPYRVAFWFSNTPPNDQRLTELCASADLVVTRSPRLAWPAACNGVNHITANDFKHLGAMELRRTQKGWTVRAAQPLRGDRYWSTPSSADQ